MAAKPPGAYPRAELFYLTELSVGLSLKAVPTGVLMSTLAAVKPFTREDVPVIALLSTLKIGARFVKNWVVDGRNVPNLDSVWEVTHHGRITCVCGKDIGRVENKNGDQMVWMPRRTEKPKPQPAQRLPWMRSRPIRQTPISILDPW